jgi:glycosyltransferase involved in cell wall biosynthesis
MRAIRLSRNRGHQRALLAGLREAQADVAVSIDADLQDDLDAVVEMVRAARAGADIVYGVRKRRTSDTAFKRLTAALYYRLLALFGVEIVFNHADFRAMSRRALEALAQFGEANLFLRGIVPQLGFTTTVVYYERRMREAGESKYPLGKMLALAWEGITSFSVVPLRVITFLGLVACLGAIAVGLWALLIDLFTDRTIPGWTSTVVPFAFIGGVQLLSLGVIGEYVGKIYLETKRRPPYFVSERLPRGDDTT